MLTAILNVKNEARTIERCLRAASLAVDQILVIDTGSTDGTPEIIESLAPQLLAPVYLEHAPWWGWSVNRPHLFRQAALLDPDGHSLLLDADEVVTLTGPRQPITSDGALICRVWPGENEVWGIRVFRNSAPWQWLGEVHELPVLPGYNPERLNWLEVDNRNDWAESAPEADRHARYAREASHFAQLLADNPTDSRAAYYHAQSLMDSGQHGAAYIAFGVRGAMRHGFDEERYLSLLKVAQYRLAWGWPAGPVVSAFRCAIESRPQRWEARCQLAEYLLRQGLDGEVSSTISGEYPIPSCDLFLVHRPSETWLPGLLSLLGDGNIPAAQHILDNAPRVNAHYRQQLQELIDHVVHR